jgi:hypothetical protein
MRRMAAVAKLRSFLTRRLDLERTGGVLFARDDRTLILADTGTFTSSHAALLQTVFPHISFSVVSSESSASGFIIVFGCDKEGDRAWQRSAMRLLLHVACLLASVWAALY